jgi:cobalt/nickel transport system permease protein
MAFVCHGWLLYLQPAQGSHRWQDGELIAAGVGSYVGLNAAALCAALEFASAAPLYGRSWQCLYCPYPISVAVPAMLLGHLTVAGLAEAGFTVAFLPSCAAPCRHWLDGGAASDDKAVPASP